MIVGVDTGGTFTDVVRRDPDGRLRIYKLLSTPEDPSRAIGRGVEEVAASGESRREAEFELVHGTTVATNALLEREGGRVALVTTAGFEDLLELRRQNRPDLYSLEVERARPLVAPEDCFGLEERVAHDGEVLRAPTEASFERIVEELAEGEYEAVAVCLLHAYANPDHERRMADQIRGNCPDLHVSTGTEVVGAFREYERASTTCLNAYVAPVMETYLGRLRSRVDAESIQVLQSSGGRIGIEYAGQYPVQTILSGPAGGVVGARATGRELGLEQIVSLDMGGTSADVSLCDGGLEITSESTIEGLPVHVPVVDLETVGAGGGSIARVDPGGGLRVGPSSAGARPGPACYGRGGTEATVTDAHVVLGRIRPGAFLGGRIELDRGRAERAVGELAGELGLGVRETARGILEVADAAMRRALKVISLERGHDPRDFALVAFGGAGPLHACRLADSLGIDRVVVPRNPGLLSAYGMLHADYRRTATRSILEPVADVVGDPRALEGLLESMRSRTVGELEEPADAFEFEWTARLRYEGQSYELEVPVDWRVGGDSFGDPSEAFEREHERSYGYRADERTVELVGLRLSASKPGPRPGGRESASRRASSRGGGSSRAEVGFREGDVETAVLDRGDLREGETFGGPAVVTEYSGTTVLPPGWRGCAESGHLLLESEEVR